MLNEKEIGDRQTPILRLRSTVPTELIRPRQRIKQPDGPWIAHPDLIDEHYARNRGSTASYGPDVTMKEYRDLWKADLAVTNEALKDTKIEDFKLYSVVDLWPSVHMQRILNKTDHEIASAIERHYVGAHRYLSPGAFVPPVLVDRFGDDWGMNARGIYYRHYYSPGWVTADHSLWLPSLDDIDWNDEVEESRRIRAKLFLKHALDNEKWNKSEYAWEADAWTDAFSLMRNDPALSVDKHEYNTIGQKRHPATCLLTGESKYIKRIPDATFGLATFQPKDYQNAVAEWDLDRERLEALLLHRQCGLISDPHWGGTSLVFPFAVYEAKGWSGDAREARRQACLAGKVYLDLLDDLSRRPEKPGEQQVQYQTDQSRNSQVFVYTSFGAHWHILVGYKRPRLPREYAGYQGVSDSVYVFQRVWSSRVTTERRAWELLSLVDQIHLWGVTDFREFVLQHLKTWHAFAKKCYFNDVNFMEHVPGTGKVTVDGGQNFIAPRCCLEQPVWTKHVTDEARLKFKGKAFCHLRDAWTKYRGSTTQEFLDFHVCGMDECAQGGLLMKPGYPLTSTDELMLHLREAHGVDDAEIAEVVHAWETKNVVRLSETPYKMGTAGDVLTLRDPRKRGPGETTDNIKVSKKRRR